MAETIKFDAFSKLSDPTSMSFVGYAPSGSDFINTQVTFKVLSSAIIALIPPASTIQSGPTTFANNAEVFIPTITNKAVSPYTLSVYTQSYTPAEKTKLAGLSSSPSFQTAAQTTISDAGSYYSTKNVEFALQYIQSQLSNKLNVGATFTHTNITDFDSAVGNTTSVLELFSIVNTTHTPSRAAQFNSTTGALEPSITTSTELGYLSGTTSSIQAQINGKLNLSGGIMTGFLTLNADPANALHAATKGYVDNLVYNLSWKKSVRAATVSALPSYSVSVDFLTLTATSNGALSAQDTVSLIVGDALLIKSETGANQANQGIFTVIQLGDASHPFILTRRIDEQTASELLGAAVYIREGTGLTINKVYVINNSSIVLGTTNITFALVAGAGTYTNGTYLTLTGNIFDINFSTFTASNIALGTLAPSYGGTGAGILTTGSIPIIGASGTYIQDSSNLFYNFSSKFVGIGTNTPDSPLTISNAVSFLAPQSGTNIHLISSGTLNSRLSADTYSNTITGSIFQGRKSRGLVGSPSSPNADDSLVLLGGDGYGSTGFHSSSVGSFIIKAEASMTDASAPTYAVIHTCPSGSVSSLERIRIASTGNVSIGAISTHSMFNVGSVNQFQINSTGVVISGTWNGSVITIANGGSGQTTANAALNAFLPSQATFSGRFLSTDGTNTSWVAGNSGTVTSVSFSGTDFSISGSPITTSGTISLSLASVNSNIGTFNTLTVNAKGLVTSASNTPYLTANQSITLSGNITGTGTTSIVTTIANNVVTNAMLAGGIDLTSKVSGILPAANGGTGINNSSSTITIGGSLIFSGAFSSTIAVTAMTSVVLPTSGTLYGTLANSITSAQLLSSISDETGSGSLVFGTNPTLTGVTILDNTNIIISATTGTEIGQSASKIGLFGVTPIVKPASANQAAVAAQTQTSLTDNTSGTASTTLAPLVDATAPGLLTAAASLSSVNTGWVVIRNYIATIAAELAKVKVDVIAIKTYQDQSRLDSIALGLSKGSA